MEMWLKRSTLLFLTVAAATVISGQHLVTLDDKMKRVEVPFGSLLALKCDLDVTGYERFWVKWYFKPAGRFFSASHNVFQKIFNRSNSSIVDSDGRKGEILWNCTTKATEENSGWYLCKVTAEIPVHTNIQSNKTEVVITEDPVYANAPPAVSTQPSP